MCGSARLFQYSGMVCGGLSGAKETKMRKFAKIALAALMVAGSVTATTAAMTSPAEARVGVSFSFGGGPGYYGGYYGPAYYPGYAGYYDPYYYPRPYYYGRPYYRGYRDYYGYRGGYGHRGWRGGYGYGRW
jgi:hypothetical protein